MSLFSVKSSSISTPCTVAVFSTLNSASMSSRWYRSVPPERSMSLESRPSGVTGDSAPSPSRSCVDFVIDAQKSVRGIQQLGAWCF